MFGGHSATTVWMDQVSMLSGQREEVSPRGIKTKEVVGCSIEMNMRYPVVCCPLRKLGYNFMAAEALWILSGSRNLSFHPQISKKLAPYSDDGETTRGAYGPPFAEQLPYVRRTLSKDRDSRQAAVVIFPKMPEPSKDVPCTVAMQFLVRHDVLHTNVFMRSSDVWLGLPYDMFSFTMMSMYVALDLGIPDLGRLTVLLGSSHLYERDWAKANYLITKWDFYSAGPWVAKSFDSPLHLMDYLGKIADSDKAKTLLEEGYV